MNAAPTAVAWILVHSLVGAAMAQPGEPADWAQTHADAAKSIRGCDLGAHSMPNVVTRLPAAPAGGHVHDAPARGGGVDWPVPPNALPELSVRVRAVFVADDDGGRLTPITPEQVRDWVDRANVCLENAAITLEFDPSPGSGDFEQLNSTLINTLTGIANPDWDAQRALGDVIAAQTPDRMTVFFRWGTNPTTPTGAGFSWTDYDFIAMPAFDFTVVCGEQNIGLFAHEVGHYLGLPHTFRAIFGSVANAEAFYVINDREPGVFDGDGRDQTLTDPFVDTFGTQCLLPSIILDGDEFPLPRANIMSYYHPVGEVVASQAGTMRQALLLRTGRSPGEGVSDRTMAPIEGEGLPIATTGGVAFTQDMSIFLGLWSGDEQVLWIDGAPGDTLASTITAPAAGRYRVYASFTAALDFGIVTHTINGQPSPPIDLYAGIVLNTGLTPLGEFDLQAGPNDVLVQITGSNPLANPARHGYGLDALFLEPLCAADLVEDGTLDFSDVLAFLTAFAAMDADADLAPPVGLFDFSDVLAFLTAFGAGCP